MGNVSGKVEIFEFSLENFLFRERKRVVCEEIEREIE